MILGCHDSKEETSCKGEFFPLTGFAFVQAAGSSTVLSPRQSLVKALGQAGAAGAMREAEGTRDALSTQKFIGSILQK